MRIKNTSNTAECLFFKMQEASGKSLFNPYVTIENGTIGCENSLKIIVFVPKCGFFSEAGRAVDHEVTVNLLIIIISSWYHVRTFQVIFSR